MPNPTQNTTETASRDLMGYIPWVDPADNQISHWERAHLENETISACITRDRLSNEPAYHLNVSLEAGDIHALRKTLAQLTDWYTRQVEAKPEIGLALPETVEATVALGAVELLHYVPKNQCIKPALCGDTRDWSFSHAKALQEPATSRPVAICPECKKRFDLLPAASVAGTEVK